MRRKGVGDAISRSVSPTIFDLFSPSFHFLFLTLPTFPLLLTLAVSFEEFLSLPWWILAS